MSELKEYHNISNPNKTTRLRFLFWTVLIFSVFMLGFIWCEKSLDFHKEPDVESVIASSPFPIKDETTKIIYSHHTNSGIAIYTTVMLCPNCLVWKYNEARNECCLIDSCKYDRSEFDKLIKELSKIQFSAICSDGCMLCGDSGFTYSFEINSNSYFSFHNSCHITGDYRMVSGLIQQFIDSHQTECEKLFKKLSRMPHERADFGEFKMIPLELQKYQIK